MRYIVKSFLLLGLIVGSSLSLTAQIYTSGSKVLHVQEALLPKEGTLTASNQMSVYGSTNAAGSVWDIRNSLFVDYTFSKYIMVSLSPTLYQDINVDPSVKESNTPLSDIGITVKTGSYLFYSDYIALGGFFNFNLPIGDPQAHNVPLEPYRGIGPSFHIAGLFSYYGDNLFPDESFSIHTNIGFSMYLDKDKRVNLRDKSIVNLDRNSSVSPTAIDYGFALKYPIGFIGLYSEVWGTGFLTEPDAYIYSNESFSYLTLGLTMRPLDFVMLELSGDVLVYGSKNTGKTSDIVPNVNYAPWKLNVGMKFNILPFKTTYTIDPTRRYQISDQETQEIRNRIRIIEEDEQVTRDKVEVLKTKRKDVETNLKQLRDLLKNLDEQPASGN